METAWELERRWHAMLPDASYVGGSAFEIAGRSGRYRKFVAKVKPLSVPSAGKVIAKDTTVPALFEELPR